MTENDVQDDLSALRAELADLRAAVSGLTGQPAVSEGHAPAGAAVESGGRSSRRNLLKLAAATAAGAGATSLLAAEPAAAANGSGLTLGTTGNAATTTTGLAVNAGGSQLAAGGLHVDIGTATNTAAIYGTTTGDKAAGVSGSYQGSGSGYGLHGDASGTGYGVYGAASGSGAGVKGVSPTTGVRGEGTGSGSVGLSGAGSTGVSGVGDTGVEALSNLGTVALVAYRVAETQSGGLVFAAQASLARTTDVAAEGNGRISQVLTPTPGAPTTAPSYAAGEQVRDAKGELYLCTVSTSADGSTPAVWVKADHVQTGYTGGSPNMLPVPMRVLDTTPGSKAPNHPGAPISPGSPLVVTVVSASALPAATTALVGTLTGIATTAQAGSAHPTTPNATPAPTFTANGLIAYSQDHATPPANVLSLATPATAPASALVTVRVSTTGKIRIAAIGTPINAVLDIVGFYA